MNYATPSFKVGWTHNCGVHIFQEPIYPNKAPTKPRVFIDEYIKRDTGRKFLFIFPIYEYYITSKEIK